MDLLIAVFKPAGFELAASAYEGLDNPEVLALELSLDVDRGLFAKTAVHPCQLAIIVNYYRVEPEELEMAKAVTDPGRPAVFRWNGRMCEKAVHSNWANSILERATRFGVGRSSELLAGEAKNLGANRRASADSPKPCEIL
jgi:citrate lyase beta subunit